MFLLPTPDISQERIGNTGSPGIWFFDSGMPGRNLMISALIHGNELCGAWALKKVLEAGIKPRRGALTLAFCNLAAFDSFNPEAHDKSRFVDEDMNRIWSATRLQGTSRESQRAQEILPWLERSNWLLDIHSMHEPSAPLLLTGLLPRNIQLAQTLGTPEHVIVDAGHKDGVRMRDYGRYGDADDTDARSLLIECGFHGDPASLDVALDQVARIMLAADIVDKDDIPSEWFLPLPEQQRILEVTQAVVAPSMDVKFSQEWQGLERLAQAGEVIAWADGQAIVTPYDNCTLIMPSLRQLLPGVTVMRLARDYRISF